MKNNENNKEEEKKEEEEDKKGKKEKQKDEEERKKKKKNLKKKNHITKKETFAAFIKNLHMELVYCPVNYLKGTDLLRECVRRETSNNSANTRCSSKLWTLEEKLTGTKKFHTLNAGGLRVSAELLT